MKRIDKDGIKVSLLILCSIVFAVSCVAFGSALFERTIDSPDLRDSLISQGVQISESAMKYDPIEVVGFWDGFLWIEDKRADLVLTEHTEYCGQDCLSEFTISTYQDSALVEDVVFYTLIDDGVELENPREQAIRSYQFSYWGNIIDYETKCVDGKTIIDEKNGTEYTPQECNQVEIGSHEGWINYNLGEVLPAGTYQIRLNGEKRPSRSVDWVIKTQGKMINEWATWGSFDYSLGTGLVAQYRQNTQNFSATGSNQTQVTDSMGLNNGTLVGKTFNNGVAVNGTTVTGGVMNFNGVNSSVSVGKNFGFQAGQGVTMILWYNASSLVNQSVFLDFGVGNSGGFRLRHGAGDSRQILLNYGNGTTTVNSFNVLNDYSSYLNSYHMITVVIYNLTHSQTYLDNTIALSTSTLRNILVNQSSSTFNIGGYSGGVSVNGSLNNVQIYNRSLSSSEVSQIYALGKDEYTNISDGLVAQYSGRDYAGSSSAPTTIYDTNHLVKGQINQGFGFVNNYVELGTPITSSVNNFTLTAWFKTNSVSQSQDIISLGKSSTTSNLTGINIRNNHARIYWRNDTTATTDYEQSGTTLSANNWYHATMVYNGSAISLYLNGTFAGSTNVLGNVFISNSRIGRLTASTLNPVNGSIDDVRIYNRSLSASEISGIYNAGIGTEDATTTTGQVTLVSPSNGATQYTRLVTTNASANVTGGAYLVNATLYDNSTGSWTARNTTIIPVGVFGTNTTYAHGVSITSSAPQTNYYGMGFKYNGSLTYTISSIKAVTGAGCDYGRIYFLNGTILSTSSISSSPTGGVMTFSPNLTLNKDIEYRVECNTPDGDRKYAPGSFPVYTSGLTWTRGSVDGVDDSSWNNIESINISSLVGFTNLVQTSINTYPVGSNIKWNYQFCDTDGACGFATSNYTFTVDNVAPSIALNYPTSLINYGAINGTLQLNFTATDINLDKVWYDYNGTNITIVGAVSGVANLSNITLSTKKNVTIYANDTAGNLNSSTFSWDYKVFENSNSYESSVTSGDTTQFIFNMTYLSIYTGTTVNLHYNGNLYTMTTSDVGTTKQYSYTLIAPTVVSTMNKTFYFEIVLSNSSETAYINSSSYNQTISPFLIDNCSSYTRTLLNMTMIDEETKNGINGTILVDASIYTIGKGQLIGTYNTSFNYIIGTPSRICLGNLTQNYSLEYTIQHYGNTSYFKKYRTIQNMTINNQTTPQNITLYNLLAYSSGGFPFTVYLTGNLLSSTGNKNLLVETQKEYISQSQFILVESSVTDNNGQTVMHLVPATEKYNFVITYQGQPVAVFNNYQVVCENSVAYQCSLTLNIGAATSNLPDFTDSGKLSSTTVYDNSTRILYTTFTTNDGSAHTFQQTILKNNNYLNNVICNNSAYGTSGTLQCYVPPTYTNDSVVSQSSIDGTYHSTNTYTLGTFSGDFKGADILIQILMLTSLVLLMLFHPIAIIIGVMLGMLSSLALLFLSSEATWISISKIIVYIFIGGAIIIWRISKSQNQPY